MTLATEIQFKSWRRLQEWTLSAIADAVRSMFDEAVLEGAPEAGCFVYISLMRDAPGGKVNATINWRVGSADGASNGETQEGRSSA